MNTRKYLGAAGGSALAMLLLAGCSGEADQGEGADKNFAWAAASQGSDVYTYSVSMSEIINQNTDQSITVQSMGGGVGIINALGDGSAQLGLANSTGALMGINGEEPFEQPITDIRGMLLGGDTPFELVTLADSGIETVEDLEGKRLAGERPALAEIGQITDAVLNSYGLDEQSVDIVRTAETNEAINALRNGEVDAILNPLGIGAGNAIELAQNEDIRFIDMSDNIDEILGELSPAYSAVVTPAGTYEDQDQDVVTPGTTHISMVSAEVSDEAVYAMTEAIVENREEIQGVGDDEDDWSIERTLSREPDIPYHSGFVEYLEDAGEWTDELDAKQEELLSEFE